MHYYYIFWYINTLHSRLRDIGAPLGHIQSCFTQNCAFVCLRYYDIATPKLTHAVLPGAQLMAHQMRTFKP